MKVEVAEDFLALFQALGDKIFDCAKETYGDPAFREIFDSNFRGGFIFLEQLITLFYTNQSFIIEEFLSEDIIWCVD